LGFSTPQQTGVSGRGRDRLGDRRAPHRAEIVPVRAVRGRLGYPLPAAVPHEIADHAIKRRAAQEPGQGLVAAEPGAGAIIRRAEII
jgi:hypothetical protein